MLTGTHNQPWAENGVDTCLTVSAAAVAAALAHACRQACPLMSCCCRPHALGTLLSGSARRTRSCGSSLQPSSTAQPSSSSNGAGEAQPCCQLHHMQQHSTCMGSFQTSLPFFAVKPGQAHNSVAEQHLLLWLSTSVSACTCIAGLPAQGCWTQSPQRSRYPCSARASHTTPPATSSCWRCCAAMPLSRLTRRRWRQSGPACCRARLAAGSSGGSTSLSGGLAAAG